MVRQAEKVRKHARLPVITKPSPIERRSSKMVEELAAFTKVPPPAIPTNPTGRPLKSRHLRDVTNVFKGKEARPAKEKVSVAGVFKRKSDGTSRDKKRDRRRKEKTPELDLLQDYMDAMEDTQTAISDEGQLSFDGIHASLQQTLLESREEDERFLKHVSKTVEDLCEPLGKEEVQTETTTNGKHTFETFSIGERIDAFKKLVEKEEAALKEYWRQWDEIQNEYLEMGIEIWGPEVFGQDPESREEKEDGFRRDMELLDMEHNTRLGELDEEIEDISVHITAKMKTSEKSLDAASKKEQARLLQSLLM